MRLTELNESKASRIANRALKEHYGMQYDLDKLDFRTTKAMLDKVRNLLQGVRSTSKLHESHRDSSYLKLVMMEQMLSHHFSDLNVKPTIVVEDDTVTSAANVMAAENMIQELQKMVERVSDMRVKDLAAIEEQMRQSEQSAQGADQFSQSASDALSQLQDAIAQAKSSIVGAQDILLGRTNAVGMDSAAAVAPVSDEPEMAAPSAELGGDLDAAEEMPELPAPDEEETGNVGRELR